VKLDESSRATIYGMPTAPREAPTARLLGALLLVVFIGGAVWAAWVHSGVPDEVAAHVPAGVLFLETGRFAGGLGNPPLGQLWVGWPATLDPTYELFEDRGLFGSRLAVTALALLGALVLWRWTRALAGEVAGLGALLFLATSPTYTAHAALATLDVPLATLSIAAVACAHAAARTGRWSWFALLGAALGAASATKGVGLALFPLIGLQWSLTPSAFWRSAPDAGRRLGGGLLVVLLITLAVVHAAYGFVPMTRGEWIPSDWIDAMAKKFVHGSTSGHHAYLLGEYSSHGWWAYFPIALAVKSPLPLLVAAGVGALAVVRDRALGVWLGLPILVFLGLAVVSSVNIGVRHLLPMYPFLFAAAGVGLAGLARRARPAAWLLVAAQGVVAVGSAPHGLAYFNVLGGGSADGHDVLVDSNYDWGQHDDALRAYLEGSSGPVAIDVDPLVPRSGRVIVGASALYGLLGSGAEAYTWLRDLEPTARIADTWFEFDVPPERAPAGATPRRARAERIALARHVLRARTLRAASSNPRFALDVAVACYAVLEYQCALDMARDVLRKRPRHRGAFWLASELTARRRLGVLRFEGREYLDGFAPLEPADAWLPPETVSALAAQLGVVDEIARLQRALGFPPRDGQAPE